MDTPILNPNSVSTEWVLFAIQFPEICQHKCDPCQGPSCSLVPECGKKLSLVVKVIQLALITDWSLWHSKSTTWTLSPILPISRFLFFLICSFSFFPLIHMPSLGLSALKRIEILMQCQTALAKQFLRLTLPTSQHPTRSPRFSSKTDAVLSCPVKWQTTMTKPRYNFLKFKSNLIYLEVFSENHWNQWKNT